MRGTVEVYEGVSAMQNLRIEPGMMVVDADGEQVGQIKELRGRYLLIDAPLQPDFWLQDGAVAGAEGASCRLRLRTGDLDPYKTGDPDQTISPHDGYAPGYKPSGVGPVRAADNHTGQQPAEFRTAGLGAAPVEETPGVRTAPPGGE